MAPRKKTDRLAANALTGNAILFALPAYRDY